MRATPERSGCGSGKAQSLKQSKKATDHMNGAQALFKALTDAGLDTCFANPGTSEMQLVHEVGRGGTVRAVLCLEENVVTGAADGYARMAGEPAFTLLHETAASLGGP